MASSGKTKWSLRGWLRGIFRRSASKTKKVSTPPAPLDAPSPRSNLTRAEKQMIMRATRGCWYVCSRDHPYLVDNCGVPLETASCPTCGELIGGKGLTIGGTPCVARGSRSIRGLA